MLFCFDPIFFALCTLLLPSPMLLCMPIALLPTYLLEYDILKFLERRNCAQEDKRVGSLLAMVPFFTEFSQNVPRLMCAENADWISTVFCSFELLI